MSEHGTRSRYIHQNCRCDACKASHAAFEAGRRRARHRALTDDDPRHGTINGYNNCLCRCDACRRARAEYTSKRGRVR